MSKNITIQNNGTPVNYNGIKKLKVKKDSGAQYWIPEDECNTGGLTVYSNGTYKASTKGLYGFSSVIVDVQIATSVTGTKNGHTYTVTVDEDGNLVWEEINGG